MLTRVGRWGYGAWAVREDELLLMAGEWTGEQRDRMIIAEKELLASTLALRTLGPLLGADCIFEFTDSTVALAAMVSLTPALEGMQRLTQQRLLLAEQHGWRLAARRVSSKGNLWADLASRRVGGWLMCCGRRRHWDCGLEWCQQSLAEWADVCVCVECYVVRGGDLVSGVCRWAWAGSSSSGSGSLAGACGEGVSRRRLLRRRRR